MIELLTIGVLILVIIVWVLSWYKVVPQTEAHSVITPRGRFVVSPDEKIATDNRKTYFAIPSYIPFLGRSIRVMDMTVKEIQLEQITYEKGQAQYQVKSSTKFRIKDVQTAAERFEDDQTLEQMLKGIIQSGVRAVTVRYDVTEARANKQRMSEEIDTQINKDLEQLGLELINFQLVDFYDAPGDLESDKVITNISRRREVEIESQTREENAERIKSARIKEAEAIEKASQREIEKDRVIGEQEQIKRQLIAEKEKLAREKEYDVIRVQQIRGAEIEKERAIIEAAQRKETEAINRDQKKLEGEGDKLKLEEQAKGEAAPILQKGLAEAQVKLKLQEALTKYDDNAIRALVAERVVEMQKEVGIETAKALSNADVRVFAGGDNNAKQGFDLAKLISATNTANMPAAEALMNRMGVPNDLGFRDKAFGIAEEVAKEVKKKGKGE